MKEKVVLLWTLAMAFASASTLFFYACIWNAARLDWWMFSVPVIGHLAHFALLAVARSLNEAQKAEDANG